MVIEWSDRVERWTASWARRYDSAQMRVGCQRTAGRAAPIGVAYRSSVRLMVAALVIGSASCGDGGDRGPEGNTNADCYGMVSEWNDLVSSLDNHCESDRDCGVVGKEGYCDCNLTLYMCGRPTSRAAYYNSDAPEIEQEFFERCRSEEWYGLRICDCGLQSAYCTENGHCASEDGLSCVAPPHDCLDLAYDWLSAVASLDASCSNDQDCAVVGGPRGDLACNCAPAIAGSCGVAVNAEAYTETTLYDLADHYESADAFCWNPQEVVEMCCAEPRPRCILNTCTNDATEICL